MSGTWKSRRAMRRLRPGDGRTLEPFRWWQPLSRSLLHLSLDDNRGRRVVHSVDVRHGRGFLTNDGRKTADLYLDGRHHAESRLPATFPVPGGVFEVASTAFGLKRCHYVTGRGNERQLIPDPRSAEGRRARLDHHHPTLSRWIGILSLILLVIPLALLVPQLIEVISRIPPVAENLGTYVSPVDLPAWLNVALGGGGALASTERALRLRYSRLLDTVG